MPTYILSLFSIIVYAALLWIVRRRPSLLDVRGWPQTPTLSRIWAVWLVFLFLLAPLTYHEGDMGVWTEAIENLFQARPLPRPSRYVYLPIYAEFLAALLWPFEQMGLMSHLLMVYVINGFVLFAYIYSTKLMAGLMRDVVGDWDGGAGLLDRVELAPLGVAIAPVTIFYLFFSTNHIVMLFLLLCALTLIRARRWFWAGAFAALSAYKFLLLPTLLVLFVILLTKCRFVDLLLFVLGGLFSLVPSAVYYVYDVEVLSLFLERRAAVGAHSYHVEPFHFFHILTRFVDTFDALYIERQLWFYLAMLGIPVSLALYFFKRLTLLQAMAMSYGFVAIFAPEPFRLEPLIGLLWLDAVFRRDLRVQTATFVVLFTHAAAWFDRANSRFLTFNPAMPTALWEARGLFIGLAIIATFLIVVSGDDKRELFADVLSRAGPPDTGPPAEPETRPVPEQAPASEAEPEPEPEPEKRTPSWLA